MSVTLIQPTETYKNKIMDFRQEFLENNEDMHGGAGLRSAETFEEWCKILSDNSCEETVRKGLVPETVFIALNEHDEVVGVIDIRHRLSEYLFKYAGHIGYSVRKSQRRKGYATEMLSLALSECKKLRIEKCLIVCNKENVASARTIIKNGGMLENEVAVNERTIQRYWIELK